MELSKKTQRIILIGLPAFLISIIIFLLLKNIIKPNFICGSMVEYGKEKYETVLINNKCWFKRNLNIGTMINGKINQVAGNKKIEKYCYNDLASNCNIFGGLYKFDEAMQGSETEGAKGICPKGFHIPTDDEFYNLENYLKGGNGSCDPNRIEKKDCGFSDLKMKANGPYNFDAILTGYHDGKIFFGMDYRATFLSSTKGIYRAIDASSAGVFRSVNDNSYSLSIRCIKD